MAFQRKTLFGTSYKQISSITEAQGTGATATLFDKIIWMIKSWCNTTFALRSHTHTTSQIKGSGDQVIACGTVDFSITTVTNVNGSNVTTDKKTFTGIYKKWSSGIYELYGVVPDKTVPQGIYSFHHNLNFPTGISFAKCPNTKNNDSSKFMYVFIATEAYDENYGTYQQWPILLDKQTATNLTFSHVYLRNTEQSAGFTFCLIGKLAN